MEGYMEQPPSGSSGCHLSCKKARISPADSCHGKDVRSIAREPSKNPIGNAFWDYCQPYQEILHTPQSSSLSMMVDIDLTGPQEFGSHSHVSQDWQASVSNSMHLSNWNGCQTLVDDPNSRWNPSVCNSGGVQNSDLTTPVQLSQGAMETSNLTAMGSYQSSSSGNLRVEDNVNFVPSNHETLDNNHIRNVDIAEAIQPSSSIPEDNYIASTSVARNLLFNIITLSPNWAFSGDHIKVCIIGRFLISPEEVQKYKWACAFGGVEVPAEVIIDGVLQCQTPSCGNGIVQLFVTCSNGLRCSEVREFEFQPIQVVDVGEDMGSAKTQQYIIRLQTLLYLESNTSRAPIEGWKAETFKLCGNVCALLEDDSKCKKLVNFTKLVKSSAHDVKDLCIQKKLRKQLRIWLLQKIAECGVGADTLDGEGQGVLHLVAALGYDWAIKPIVDARIISIDLLDVNQYTALDWASRNGRNHTVKLLESYGATPRYAREPIPTYTSIVGLREPIPTNPDFKQIQQMAKSGWLPPSVICGVLGNHQQYTIETESPTRPPSGSLFLFDRSIQPRYRNDGHKWLKESHSEIKDFDLYCCYARGKENKHFYRRCYRMKGASSNIVLVHYLEVKASTSRSKHGSNLTGDHNSDDNPDLGREHYHYPSSGPPAVNQTTKPNGANQMERSNAGGLQNSCLIGSGRVQHTLKLLDATSTEYSSESSFDGNFNVEDSDDYSSSKQLLLDGLVGDDIVMIDSLDCCTSDQLEVVTEKTIQPCSWKGTDRSEDGDEKTPEDLSSSFGHQGISSYHLAESITLRDSIRRNQGKAVVTVSEQSATPLGYDDHEFEPSDDHARSLLLQDSKRVRVHMAAVRIQNRFRSWKVRKELLLTRQQIIKIQDSSQSRSDLGKGVVTVPEQSATPVGVGYNVWKFFGVSDDHVLPLLRLRTNKAGQYSEPVHAAAVRIQNKYRSWKGRKDFLLTRQQIIKIQGGNCDFWFYDKKAHVRGYQVRVKKALDASEISMVDSMNVPSEVRANKGTNQSIISTMKMITEMVSEKPVVLFTKATCCLSHTIKSLIVNFGVNPTIYELDNIPAGPKIEQVLSRLGCNPASPALFIWGEFVGGANEILSLHLKGSLKLKLQGERPEEIPAY